MTDSHSASSSLSILDRRIILVTGKGGVGRTTVTASLAEAARRKGRKILIAEIGEPGGDYSPLARIYQRDTLPEDPQDLAQGIQGCLLWPRKGHTLYVEDALPIKALARAAMRSKALNRLLEAAPSFNEMGVFYQLLKLYKATDRDGKPTHDTIIVDMPATGHTLALTGLPDVLLRIMPTGPIAELLREGKSILNNPTLSTACIVTLPETLPVSESLELIDGLRETQMDIGAVLVNKVVEDHFTPEERAWLETRTQEKPFFGITRFLALAEIERSLQRLNAHANVPVFTIPEFTNIGSDLVRQISATFLPKENL